MVILTQRFGFTSGLGLVSLLLTGSTGFCAGLEKAVIWSGHYAGLAGAASAPVEGPESLFFNPAGLGKAPGLQIAGNFSPTLSKFSAPIPSFTTGTVSTTNSETSFSPPGAVLASFGVTPQLGIAVGYFVSGGTRAIFESVDFGPGFSLLKPTLQSDVTITELSAGAGYEILDGLRIGLAYRIVSVKGTLGFAQRASIGGSTGLLATTLDGISATQYNGFRVGIQYAPKDSTWGLGAQWRTEVQFAADANVAGSFLAAGGTTVSTFASSPASLGATFPQQVSIGGFYDLSPKTWRVLAEYTFTEYHQDQSLYLSGRLGGLIPLSSRSLNWNNLNNLRAALEYKPTSNLALRGGYIFTSQVTPNSDASPVYSSPGVGHSYILGAGMTFSEALAGDLAFEYSHASGTVSATDGPTAGDYSSNGYTAHLGVTYRLL
jgi:long-subunit fatty acid transport protein